MVRSASGADGCRESIVIQPLLLLFFLLLLVRVEGRRRATIQP